MRAGKTYSNRTVLVGVNRLQCCATGVHLVSAVSVGSTSAFDRSAGQEEFRAQFNPLLARYEAPLELSSAGEVIARTPEEMCGLLDGPVPASADQELITSRVEAAVALYRGARAVREADRAHQGPARRAPDAV